LGERFLQENESIAIMKQPFKRGQEVLASNDNVNWDKTAFVSTSRKEGGVIEYWCVEPLKYAEWAKKKRYDGLVSVQFKYCKNA
jgi:hypothetical protein